MPLPLILAGAAVVAGGFGVKKGFDARKDSKDAKSLNDKAAVIYEKAVLSLNAARQQAQESLEQLGETRLKIGSTTLVDFTEAFKKIRLMNVSDKKFLREGMPALNVSDKKDFETVSFALSEMAGSGVAALGSGGLAGLAAYGGVKVAAVASSGTAISTLSGAAATNATLAWLGGGSLATGGMGVAGGTAVLGGIVAGPVLAVGGMIMASKAKEAKNKALSNLDQAELAVEQMKTAELAAKGIQLRCEEITQLLLKLDELLKPAVVELQQWVARRRIYWFYPKSVKHDIWRTFSLAKTVKNLLTTQIMSDQGEITQESEKVVENTKVLLSQGL